MIVSLPPPMAPAKSLVGVRGYLLLTCFVFIVVNPLFAVAYIKSVFSLPRTDYQQYVGLQFIDHFQRYGLVAMQLVSFCAGVLLLFRRPGAVKFAKVYLSATLVFAVNCATAPFCATLPPLRHDVRL